MVRRDEPNYEPNPAYRAMSARLALIAATVSAMVSCAHVAHAGCPNACTLATKPVAAADPPLECMRVTATDETCDCGVFVDVINDCAEPLAAVGFTFDNCFPRVGSSEGQGPCVTLAPRAHGNVRWKFEVPGGTGAKERVLALKHAEAEHSVRVAATVSAFGSDGGCSATAAIVRPSGNVAIAALVGLALAVRRRARRRSERGGAAAD
jgi:MYXO-CTERM domain-containing protein